MQMNQNNHLPGSSQGLEYFRELRKALEGVSDLGSNGKMDLPIMLTRYVRLVPLSPVCFSFFTCLSHHIPYAQVTCMDKHFSFMIPSPCHHLYPVHLVLCSYDTLSLNMVKQYKVGQSVILFSQRGYKDQSKVYQR